MNREVSMPTFNFGGRGRQITPKWGMVFFGFFMAMGILALSLGVSAYLEAQQVQDWPSTTGTVTDTNVREEWVSEGGRGGGHSHYEYYPEVQYSYSVGGSTYYGNDISKLESSYTSYSGAQAYLTDHRVGSQVTVYYNPDNPSEAVLEKNSDFEALMIPGVGVLFTAIGAIGFIYYFRKWRA
jgi:hypothetical protein